MTRGTLLFIDDHPLYREGVLRTLAEALPGLKLLEADALPAALALLGAHDVDLVLADYHLEAANGVDALRVIRGAFPTVACALISGDLSPALARQARQIGAAALLSKSRDAGGLAQAIGALLDGTTVYDADPPQAGGEDGGLTERRLDILRRASRGESNKQIARALGVAERTVKDHWTHILARLAVGNRTEAVGVALRNGLIEP